MAEQWYYATRGQRHGPITDERLHLLAKSGELQPTDLVWSKGMAKWMPAHTVKGLTFPSPVAQSSPGRSSGGISPADILNSLKQTSAVAGTQIARAATDAAKHGVAISEKTRFWENPIFVGLSLFFCFPAGLVFTWIHPTWTRKTKWILTGAVAALPALGIIANLTAGGGITEDYLPHKVGARCQYEVHGDGVEMLFTYVFRENGVTDIDSHMVVSGYGGSFPKSTEQRRVAHGFIEVGRLQEGVGTVWQPELKLGAVVGDQWEKRVESGVTVRYKVTAFGLCTLNRDGKEHRTVTVVWTLDGPPAFECHCVYAENIGLLAKECFVGGKLVAKWNLCDGGERANLTDSEQAFYK